MSPSEDSSLLPSTIFGPPPTKGSMDLTAPERPGRLISGELDTRRALPVPPDFNRAVLEYLTNHYPESSEAFAAEAGLTKIYAEGSRRDLLLSKWTATARLSMRVSDLEKQIKELQQKIHLYDEMAKVKTGAEGVPSAPAVNVLEGHRSAISAVVFHPVFLLVFTASEDATIRVWELETEHGSLERTLRDHTDAVNALCFDTTGRWLASGSSDTSIKIWDVTKMECARTLHGHSDMVSAVSYIRSRRSLLISGSRDKDIKLWDTSSGDCLKTFSSHTDWIKDVAFCPQIPLFFASCSADFTISTWYLSECGGERRASQERVSFSLLRRGLHSGGEQSAVVANLEGHEHVVASVCFASNATLQCLVAAGIAPKPCSDDSNPLSSVVRRPRRGSATDICSPPTEDDTATADPVLEHCAPVLFSASRDSTIKMWDAVRGDCLSTFVGHANWVKQVQCHVSGRYLLSVSDDCTMRIWNVVEASCSAVIKRAHEGFLTCIAVHPTKNFTATGSIDMKLKIWAAQSGSRSPTNAPREAESDAMSDPEHNTDGGTCDDEEENEREPGAGANGSTETHTTERGHSGVLARGMSLSAEGYTATSVPDELVSPVLLGEGPPMPVSVTPPPPPPDRTNTPTRLTQQSVASTSPGSSPGTAKASPAIGGMSLGKSPKLGTGTRTPPSKFAKAAPGPGGGLRASTRSRLERGGSTTLQPSATRDSLRERLGSQNRNAPAGPAKDD